MYYEYREGEGFLPVGTETPSASGALTVGFVERDAAPSVCRRFGFHPDALQNVSDRFRSGVELHEDYTFTELRVIRPPAGQDDCVALFMSGAVFIVMEVDDPDHTVQAAFSAALRRFSARRVTVEKLVAAFLDCLITGDETYLEDAGMELTRLERDVFAGRAGADLNEEILTRKTQLLRMHNFYEQLLDITEALEENENEVFDEDQLIYMTNLSKKVSRLREDVDTMNSLLSHLQDAYSAYLDLQLNRSMKVFTVLTSIFFPLTIIAGWYGMNFVGMPELHWKYGYLYVILLSAAVSAVLILIGKKKKWY